MQWTAFAEYMEGSSSALVEAVTDTSAAMGIDGHVTVDHSSPSASSLPVDNPGAPLSAGMGESIGGAGSTELQPLAA